MRLIDPEKVCGCNCILLFFYYSCKKNVAQRVALIFYYLVTFCEHEIINRDHKHFNQQISITWRKSRSILSLECHRTIAGTFFRTWPNCNRALPKDVVLIQHHICMRFGHDTQPRAASFISKLSICKEKSLNSRAHLSSLSHFVGIGMYIRDTGTIGRLQLYAAQL